MSDRPLALADDVRAWVRHALAAGCSPNEISDAVDAALHTEATDWVKWGDGCWRPDTVCAACGSSLAGICGGVDPPRSCTGGEPVTILRREYEARKSPGAGPVVGELGDEGGR